MALTDTDLTRGTYRRPFKAFLTEDGRYVETVALVGTDGNAVGMSEDTGQAILKELKIMNLHLMTMTDNHFTKQDVEV